MPLRLEQLGSFTADVADAPVAVNFPATQSLCFKDMLEAENGLGVGFLDLLFLNAFISRGSC